ncbi:UDP-N-acetylmuramate dehydrogenase [Flavisolibacter ginsenosidimutans]|uniref:UDP-N-acetylenolpyruvoylglucosamine reductase n=1 Tax=Flavisolibacter ginsenosidimutans TaxID=661481 RepID=A0A5B8UFB4_9BACT|nr:UDP-N-acetylmuramate dehydrogenase [Flavisolibacter ginsenosidimutans]QEC55198.1 UDP-N-acetylmuramate dehydrogenase [Flavisolibacter ginsenosidimutans]
MQIRENISLWPYNTFGIDASARYFASFQNLAELEELVNWQLRVAGCQLILGGGSNILLTKDVDGLVLKNEIKGIAIVKEDDEHIYLKAGAGENWHRLVMHCVENNYAGIENLSLIPGNVGASPMQNIGAYGVEIKDVFHELEAFHLLDKNLVKFELKDCEFGYRESVFKRKYKGEFAIASVTYRLNKKPVYQTSYGAINQELERMGVKELNIQAISQAVVNIRSAKLPDPKVIGNAGSFFKNPQVEKEQFVQWQSNYQSVPSFPFDDEHVKIPAGWLIEQCGWKGYRNGDAGCYSKQALVLVNYGSASGQEIYALSEAILQSVETKFGIRLEREVNVL